jgi:hypothetical protein
MDLLGERGKVVKSRKQASLKKEQASKQATNSETNPQ